MMKEHTNDTATPEPCERLSALTDGELQGDAFAEVMLYAATDEGQRQWQVYHLIGEVLRSSEPVALGTPWLLPRLRQQLAKEPQPSAVESAVSATEVIAEPLPAAANASVLRWKAAAGCASLAAAVALGWNVHLGMVTAHVAQAPVSAPAPTALAASDTGVQQSLGTISQHTHHAGDGQAMLRDPRLDELLAAHRQLGNTTALQMPAGFLRNATFEAPKR